jgi:L,D-peptidoglycan transpeptidase YkuD (ErfK/YbiS/YcfS/YnhG family)
VVASPLHPVVPGKGSGIFLHAQTGGPTIGCISLRKDQLRSVLRWLRPDAAPVIAIGTAKQLRA